MDWRLLSTALFTGILLCSNSPVDPTLLQIVQEGLKFLQDNVDNLCVEFDQEKVEAQQEQQNTAIALQEVMQMAERPNGFQGNDV